MSDKKSGEKAAAPKLLSKEQVLEAADRKTEVVEVPEWEGAVMVQALSAYDQSEYNQHIMQMEADSDGNVQTRINTAGGDVLLASMAIVDPETRERLFTPEELRPKSNAAIQRVVKVARKISGMDVDKEEAKGN